MATRPRTLALVVAAGSGTRFGGDRPKQVALLAGKPLVRHAVDALAGHRAIDDVVVVGDRAVLADSVGDRAVLPGGASRRQSVANGLEAIAGEAPARVLIHDAARPMLPGAVVDRLLAALEDRHGAIPVLPVADTLVRLPEAETVAREGLARVQTPQAFRFASILAAHRNWSGEQEPTDDAQMLRAAGHEVATVTGDARLEKITYPEDLHRMEMMLGRVSVTGFGYDVHRLMPGLPLWLGGIRIEHSHGLLGHSDADAGLHAITDAVLGAIGAGDIGSHFPPSDPQWRGAASDRFLVHARDLVEAAGGTVEHVDLTLICEAPRIGPRREAMRARIADLLRLPLARVSVKATTTERLGFTGRQEGIAAQAIATISLPRSF